MKLNRTFTALAAGFTLAASMLAPMTASAMSNASNASSQAAEKTESAPLEVVETTNYTAKRNTGSLKTFNPHRMTMDTEYDMAFYTAGALYVTAGDTEKEPPVYKYVPYHAKSMAETTDGIVWNIPLKDGLQWTDGTPVTAEDYEYSMKMLLDPKLVNDNVTFLTVELNVKNAKEYAEGTVDWDQVGIKAIDGNILQITLDKEMDENTFYGSMASTYMVKKDLYEAGMNADRTETSYATDLKSVPSCGPYKMVEFIPDQYVKIEKTNFDALKAEDSNYYKPGVIEFGMIKSGAARLQEFLNGNLDYTSIPNADWDNYKDDPRMRMGSANTVWGFFVNSKTPKEKALTNKNIRQALFWATNREEIAGGIFKTYQPAPFWVGILSMVGDLEHPENYREKYGSQVIDNPYGYDVEKAKALFDKGYEENGNTPLNIEMMIFDNSDTDTQLAAYLQDQWKQIFGADRINVEVKQMPSGSAYDAYEKGEYDIGMGANGQSATNPWLSLAVWTTNYPGKANQMANAEFDKLQEASVLGDDRLDPEKKIQNLIEMEKIMLDEVPSIPLFANTNAVLFQEDIVFPFGDGMYIPVVGFGINQMEKAQ